MTYVAILLVAWVQGGVNTTLSPFLNQFDVSLNQVGYFVTLMATMRLASRLPTGAMYAPSRGRRILFLAFPLMAAAQLGYASSRGLLLATLSTAILGATQGVCSTVLLALTIDLRPRNRSPSVIMGWFATAISGGFVIGNSVTGYLADHIGFQATFFVLGVVALLGVLPLALLSIPESEEKISLGESWRHLVTRVRHFLTYSRRREWGTPILDPGTSLATLIGFQLSFVGHSILAFFPLFALSVGLNLTNVGALMSTASLSSFSIRPLAFLLFRISNCVTVSVVGVLLSSVALMLFPEVGLPLLFGLFVIVGLVRGVNRVAGATLVAERGNGSGMASSVFNAGLDIGALAGPAISGWLASWVGISDMFRLFPVLLAGFFLLTLIAIRRRGETCGAAVEEGMPR